MTDTPKTDLDRAIEIVERRQREYVAMEEDRHSRGVSPHEFMPVLTAKQSTCEAILTDLRALRDKE